jgi:hypothetical protein
VHGFVNTFLCGLFCDTVAILRITKWKDELDRIWEEAAVACLRMKIPVENTKELITQSPTKYCHVYECDYRRGWD